MTFENQRFLCVGVLCAAMSVTSCTYSPRIAEKQQYAGQCEMISRKLELQKDGYSGKFKEKKGPVLHKTTEERIKDQLIFEGVLSAASLIVSGSIVITGNAIHWMEYKTKC